MTSASVWTILILPFTLMMMMAALISAAPPASEDFGSRVYYRNRDPFPNAEDNVSFLSCRLLVNVLVYLLALVYGQKYFFTLVNDVDISLLGKCDTKRLSHSVNKSNDFGNSRRQ